MSIERDTIQSARRELRHRYGELYDRLTRLLFETDPMGVNYQDNTGEYEPEVDTILPRLRTCRNAADVQRVVHEEFCRWFGADIVGGLEKYERLGRDIWVEIREKSWSEDDEK